MSERPSEISVQEAHRDLAAYRVLDVREPNEYTGELGHIAGSRLLPLGQLTERLASGESPGAVVGEDPRPLLVVCRSGGRSGKACAALAGAGFAEPINLAGGMLAWNEAGLPVVREDGDAPAA